MYIIAYLACLKSFISVYINNIFLLFVFIQYTEDDIPGTLTKHKWKTLGTPDAVKQSRISYQMNQQKKQGKIINAAHKNYIFVEEEGDIICEKSNNNI